MQIQIPGGTFDTKNLPKPVQRQIRRKRIKAKVAPIVQMALVALVVDVILRLVL